MQEWQERRKRKFSKCVEIDAPPGENYTEKEKRTAAGGKAYFAPNYTIQIVDRAGKNALGIGLVLRLADEVRYTYSLNLNNLTILLRGQGLTAISDA